MKDWQRENEVKLQLLHSLSRSQTALARLIECAAASCEAMHEADPDMMRSLEMLGLYQRILGEKLLGIQLRDVRQGRPPPPWLAKERSK